MTEIALAAAIVAAQSAQAQQALSLAMVKQQVALEQAVVEMLNQATDQIRASNRILDVSA